ncbi:MAG: SUMF1/EgtB/PvdO family nonheme iron enzyme [Treponema sp.]|nr:SUMF1/EgtB/PvdO family nonheme iron enzyme [Treponema sp.]
MKLRLFKLLPCLAGLFVLSLPLFAQPKLVDATSKVEYAIEWHLNGGTQNSANTDTYTAEDGLVLAIPTRAGYTFDGWFVNADLSGNKVTAIAKGETQKKTFYAGWVITKEQAIKIMQEEMVTVIPKGKKTNLDDFAGTSGTQVINAYEIAKHEVTQELYMAVMGANPSYFKNNPASGEVQEKRPVEYVSWYDAVYFCNKLSMIMGLTPAYSVNGQTEPDKWSYIPHKGNSIRYEVICDYSASGFRLPTEGEWEMAARGGVAGGWNYKYSGSDDHYYVSWDENSSDSKTHEVGKKRPNALGVYDMTGNVCEWCNTKYEESSSDRVYRGGHYTDYREVSYRGRCYPTIRDIVRGFRLARTPN